MFEEPAAQPAAEVMELEIRSYKNLRDVRVSWSPRTLLYGPNGAGKSNLLEAFALCFGSQATLWQLAGRAAPPVPGAISALLRASTTELPPPPRGIGGWAKPEADPSGVIPFWQAMGATSTTDASSWDEVAERLFPEPLADLVARAGERPLIRYRLEALTGLTEAAQVDRGRWVTEDEGDAPNIKFARRFSRCLVLDGGPPDWLVAMQDQLPDVFAPFRAWLDQSPDVRSENTDLLELPAETWAPVVAVWLASERSTTEAFADVQIAWERALDRAILLTGQLDRLRFRTEPADDEEEQAQWNDHRADTAWWLVVRAADLADRHVRALFPYLGVEPEDQEPANIVLERKDEGARARALGYLSDPLLLEGLSSGERVWVDVALAHAAAFLEDFGVRAAASATALERLPDEVLLEMAVELEPDLEVLTQGYWDAADLTLAHDYLDRYLGPPAEALRRMLFGEVELNRGVADWILGQVFADLRSVLQPPRLVEVIDEPERHLHPKAQRLIQRLLSEPAHSDVVIATHSAHFLAGRDWHHLHVSPTPEGTVVTAFDAAHLETASAIARQMGLTGGELLNRTTYVLVVEGLIDEIIITTLFREHLDENGVLVLPMYGVDEVLSLAEWRIFGELVDVGVGVLVDHARREVLSRQTTPDRLTKEEQALRDLERRLKRRGRRIDLFGLLDEDIMSYLDGAAVAAEVPTFPGWEAVTADRRSDQTFKEALKASSGGATFGRKTVRSIVERMRSEGLPPHSDLAEVVASVIEAARTAGTDRT